MVFKFIKFNNFELLNKLFTINSFGSVLFKDTFSQSFSSPLPALAEADTKGVWATVDVENLMSVSGGKLNVPAQATAVWGEEYRRAQPNSGQQYWERPSGKALVAVGTFNLTTKQAQYPIGWWQSSTLDTTSGAKLLTTSGSINAAVTAVTVSDGQSYNTATDYQAAAVWTSWGVLIYVKIAGIWYLKWVNPIVFTQGYCGFSNFSAVGTIDDFKIVAVDESLFNAALDISNPSVGNLPNMPDGDFLLHLDNITRPSAGEINLYYRKKDTSNFWWQNATPSGAFQIIEKVNAGNTTRISTTGVVSTDDIVTIARAQTIQAWRNTTALGSAYTAAYNFLREVGLELNSLGTGGAIGNIKVWKARCLTENGLGNDVVVNGDFATDTVWNKGTGWTISGGTANKAAGSGANLSQASILTIGTYYELTFTVSNYSAGGLTPQIGGSGTLALITANGTYTYRGVCAGDTTLYLQANAPFVGSIDNVSCKAIQFTDDSVGLKLNEVLLA